MSESKTNFSLDFGALPLVLLFIFFVLTGVCGPRNYIGEYVDNCSKSQ